MEERLKGRGAVSNPKSRFETIEYVRDEDAEDAPPDEDPLRTMFLRDPARTIIASNDSPDVSFTYSVNPYRGCEHGCIYCFARPSHEYLGFSAGLDFETKILVKEDAPALLRKELSAPSWRGDVIAMSGVTDCYQPIEKKLRLTRGCLEVLNECRNPVAIITKNHLVTRDVDLLVDLASRNAARVYLSITTLDEELARKMEPRTSSPKLRFDAVETLAKAGVPVGVMMAPLIPGLTDHEIPSLLERAAGAGASGASYVMLRLPWNVAPLFDEWLGRHFPDRRDKILHRIQSIRGGKLNDPRWSVRQTGEGIFAEQAAALFEVSSRRFGLQRERLPLSSADFRRPEGAQKRLF